MDEIAANKIRAEQAAVLRDAVEKLGAAWEDLAVIETYANALKAGETKTVDQSARKALLSQQLTSIKSLRRNMTAFLSRMNDIGKMEDQEIARTKEPEQGGSPV